MLKGFLRGVKNFFPLPPQLSEEKNEPKFLFSKKQRKMLDRQIEIEKLKNTVEGLALASKNGTVKRGFVHYKEAAEKLGKAKKILKEKVEKQNQSESHFMPAWAFLLALSAEIKVLEAINKDYFNSPVAWDAEINLISYPTLIADAAKASDILLLEDGVKIILKSFREWTLFCVEEIKCRCGEKGFNARKIQIEIWLNHILAREKNSLIIKQFVGIRTDDLKHLKEHYTKPEETANLKKFYKESRLWSNVNLIWFSVNRLIFENNSLHTLYDEGIEAAREFYDPFAKSFEFSKRFMEIVKSGLKSFEEK